VLELEFEDGQGATATDTSGKGHNGAISGAAWSTQGHSGKALSFDGVNDRVTVADHNDLDLGSDFTVEGWVRPDTLAEWQTMMLKESPPGTLSYALYATAGGGPVPNAWTAGGAVVSPRTVLANQWTHLATTYASGTMRLYMNRELVAVETGVPAPPATGGPLQIGGNTIWASESFDGLIDDVRVFRVALDPDEMAGGGSLGASAKVGPRLKRGCRAKGAWASSGEVKRASCKRRRR
jgi:hypothetical protein